MSPDHEKFENFLKQFRPRAPRPLPIARHEGAARGKLAFGALVATAGVFAVAFFIGHGPASTRRPSPAQNVSSTKPLTNSQPLTLGRANALLLQAPSIQAAVDSLAFQSQATPTPKGTRSALAALGEENLKEKMKL